jgi:hypothetical protein
LPHVEVRTVLIPFPAKENVGGRLHPAGHVDRLKMIQEMLPLVRKAVSVRTYSLVDTGYNVGVFGESSGMRSISGGS